MKRIQAEHCLLYPLSMISSIFCLSTPTTLLYVLVTFLSLRHSTWHPQLKGREVYFDSWCVEVSVHSRLVLRQACRGFCREETDHSMEGESRERSREEWGRQTLPVIQQDIPTMLHSAVNPSVDWSTITHPRSSHLPKVPPMMIWGFIGTSR